MKKSLRYKHLSEIMTNTTNKFAQSVNQQKRRNDLGLYTITENPSYRWLFRTPSLRNISLTAPYMHNGIFSNLDEVIETLQKNLIHGDLTLPEGLKRESFADD